MKCVPLDLPSPHELAVLLADLLSSLPLEEGAQHLLTLLRDESWIESEDEPLELKKLLKQRRWTPAAVKVLRKPVSYLKATCWKH